MSGHETQETTGLGASLSQALGYVAAWRGKQVVVKFGGSALAKGALGTLIEDLVLLQQAGLRPVLVHGGGAEISAMLNRLGVEPRFVDGLRVTDAETIHVVEMVLAGRVNKHLVGLIQKRGGRAVGLSGKDGGLIKARPHEKSAELGFVGKVDGVDTTVLDTLLAEGFIPVVASLGVGDDQATYNLNADTAASALAVALAAEKFILLTDVQGIYRETQGQPRLISELDLQDARRLIKTGVVSKGMIPKLEACLTAVAKGLPSAHIIAAGEPHGLLVELFTETGIGTLIRSRRRAGASEPNPSHKTVGAAVPAPPAPPEEDDDLRLKPEVQRI